MLLRKQMAGLQEIAEACAMDERDLRRIFGSKEQLVRAIFAEVLRRLHAGDQRPWPGYGGGLRRSLEAVRSFEDGYVLLVREATRRPRWAQYARALRHRTAERLVRLLWSPSQAPAASLRPAALAPALEPMVSFCNDALAQWVRHGDPTQDERFIRWNGQMVRAWRRATGDLLDIGSGDNDWPSGDDNGAPQ